MSSSAFAERILIAPVFALIALFGVQVQTQEQQPINSGANPYRTIRPWSMGPEGRPWGGSNGVAIDRDGKSVWSVDRCVAGSTPGCVGSKANPVNKFDESGKLLTSFGAGMFAWPHGLHVDRGARGDLAGEHDVAVLHQDLARHAAVRVLRQVGIEDGIGDEVADLVGMPFADLLGCEYMAAGTGHRSSDWRQAARAVRCGCARVARVGDARNGRAARDQAVIADRSPRLRRSNP